MVKVPIWAKILCLGGFLVVGCSFIAMDLLTQQEPTDHFNCTEPEGADHYGEPITETGNADASGVITYTGNQTFTLHIDNPTNNEIELLPHPAIHPVSENVPENGSFSSTASEIDYRYQIQTDNPFRQGRVFEEFDGDGYFPIPEPTTQIDYSVPNGEQVGTRFGVYGEDMEVTIEEQGCHTVILMDQGQVGSGIAFNEMTESMGNLEYGQPYEYTYLFSVGYDVSSGQSDSYIGKAYEHNAWIEAGSLHSAEQNILYHEYIHTRQYAYFDDNMNHGRNGMSESFAVYNDIMTRQESNQISEEMAAGLFSLRNHDVETPYEGQNSYRSGATLLYTLNQKYDIDIQQLEMACNGNYTEACFSDELRDQNPDAATFFTNETTNYSTTQNSPDANVISWVQLIIYTQYTTVLRIGILTLLVVWVVLKLRTIPWKRDREL